MIPADSALPSTPDPNIPQREASEPNSIVWVSASAGSGKTKVLTDRVLRLLLPEPSGHWAGTPPHRLLCITYTKAAAAEMALRVQNVLSKWVVMPESKLAEELAQLTGYTAEAHMITAARRLFARVLDCPGGLKIMTIHSFCQSVLSRFPLEAGVNPDFSVLDEQIAYELLAQSLNDVLKAPRSEYTADAAQAFQKLAVFMQHEDLTSSIRTVLERSEVLEDIFASVSGLENLEIYLKTQLDLAPHLTEVELRQSFRASTDSASLRNFITQASGTTKTLAGIAQAMQAWLETETVPTPEDFTDYQDALLTQNGTPRKLGKFVDEHPELADFFVREGERVTACIEQISLLRQTTLTAALLYLSYAVFQGYEAAKKRVDGLDYNDLIRKTASLLERTSGKWVHFKLDGGIDHILMDEAQDTNAYQWSILETLASEIFAQGSGAEQSSNPRTLFIVGDKKQSIFSFQGADPASFERMQAFFSLKAEESERPLKKIPLEVSFRTTPPVLKLVDTVFSSPDMKTQIGLSPDDALVHYSWRSQEAGLVELWPLLPRPAKEKSEKWELPFNDAEITLQTSLAEQVAQQVSFWLQKGEILESQGRPIIPGDILILVRTRTAFVHQLVRQLKRRNIPVSGIDRLSLGDQIGVQDMLALARFAHLPDDDFSLACILRSPFIDLDEEALMQLALNRSGLLWQQIQSSSQVEVTKWLTSLIANSQGVSPFEFFEMALNSPCPADLSGSGWRAMTKRLGTDVIDPLEELLALCLKLEPQGVRTLEDLILWQQNTDVQIKREMEEAAGQVRIMTVHAAKGLEAPIVILPDTTSAPDMGKVPRFLWPDQNGLRAPLWSPGKDFCKHSRLAREGLLACQHAENARLLYVALTRAKDRLYIMGSEGRTKSPVWYKMIEEAFNRIDGVTEDASGRRKLALPQRKQAPTSIKSPTPPKSFHPIPDWLEKTPPAENLPTRVYTPSAMDMDFDHSDHVSRSPLEEESRRIRGIITHKLFQFLPDLPLQGRQVAAEVFVRRAGKILDSETQNHIIAETLGILNDPLFSRVFSPNSLAEVSLGGTLPDGRRISGQVDRLVISPDDVLIVDYKTSRNSPLLQSDIPLIYLEQMRAYHGVLSQIYPKSLIKCAILWTEHPLLMPVPI